MTAHIQTPSEVVGFIIQKRGADVLRNAGTPEERLEPYWFKLSDYPGTLEQTLVHVERAFTGELRVVRNSLVVWEGVNE